MYNQLKISEDVVGGQNQWEQSFLNNIETQGYVTLKSESVIQIQPDHSQINE